MIRNTSLTITISWEELENMVNQLSHRLIGRWPKKVTAHDQVDIIPAVMFAETIGAEFVHGRGLGTFCLSISDLHKEVDACFFHYEYVDSAMTNTDTLSLQTIEIHPDEPPTKVIIPWKRT